MGSLKSTPSVEVKEFVDQEIRNNKIILFSKTYCSFCSMAKASLKEEVGANFKVVELDQRNDGDQIQGYLKSLTGATTVPRVFIHGKCIGGGTETQSLQKSGQLRKLINEA